MMNQMGFMLSLSARLRAEGTEVISINFCVPPDDFKVFLQILYVNPRGGHRSLSLKLPPHHIPVYLVAEITNLIRRDIETLRIGETRRPARLY